MRARHARHHAATDGAHFGQREHKLHTNKRRHGKSSAKSQRATHDRSTHELRWRCSCFILLFVPPTPPNPTQPTQFPKPPLKPGYLRKGVVSNPLLDTDPNFLPKLLDDTVWQRRYGDAPMSMDLELQHTLVAFEQRAELGDPMLLHLTNPPGYTAAKLATPLRKGWDDTKDAFLDSIRADLVDDLPTYRYASREAVVRYGKDLCDAEQHFIQRRLLRVREALAKFLDLDLSKVPTENIPRIGIACSGGGYRALLARFLLTPTHAACSGRQKTKNTSSHFFAPCSVLFCSVFVQSRCADRVRACGSVGLLHFPCGHQRRQLVDCKRDDCARCDDVGAEGALEGAAL